MTSNTSSSTHQTMMSSSTEASTSSRRWVYCARPGAILARSLVNAHCSRSSASAPSTRTVPRWDTSKTTASRRQARCSSSVPAGYATGISHPPKGTIRAPRARCTASSGLCSYPVTSGAITPLGGAAASVRRLGGARPVELADAVVEARLHPAEGQHVDQHALPGAVHHVDQLAAVADHHVAAADHQVRGGDVGAHVLAHVGERPADRLELDPGIEQALDHPQLEEVLVAVQPPAAAAGGVDQRRAHEVRPRPVVQLAIGDADDALRRVAGVAVLGHRALPCSGVDDTRVVTCV